MTCIADANVLFPLLVDRHVAHDTARRWWEKRSDDSVGLCLLTRMAVLRLLTNRVAMNGAPTAPEVALNDLELLLARGPQTLSSRPRLTSRTRRPGLAVLAGDLVIAASDQTLPYQAEHSTGEATR
jgi:predicted nucleic acid-binding protein